MEQDFVTGTVIYRERMALPENAVINVQIQDTTLADAPAVVVGETTFKSGGKQVPIPFEVGYDPAEIDESRIYTLRATISLDGKMRWTTDKIVRVITDGYPTGNLELMLAGVSSGKGAGDALVGTLWKWRKSRTPVEEIIPPDPARYTIEFMSDGRYAGQADCNRIMGGYTTEGSSITIQPGATTLMACPEGSLEWVYTQQLFATKTYFFKGGHLFMVANGGTMEFAP